MRNAPTQDDMAAASDDGATGRSPLSEELGRGLLVSTYAEAADGGPAIPSAPEGSVAARLHISEGGRITVMTGKVDVGQGARKQFTMAAAEELRAPMESVHVIMGDTALTPDDGGTYASRNTPSNVPEVRRACAVARRLMAQGAARMWRVDEHDVVVEDGFATHAESGRRASYGELAGNVDIVEAFAAADTAGVSLTPVAEWHVLGGATPRPRIRDLVTGGHAYPSDISRPGMLHGKVPRAPRHGAALIDVDTTAAEAIDGVRVVTDGDFVGCVAPTSYAARAGIEALTASATWTSESHVNGADLFERLRQTARRPERTESTAAVDDALTAAAKVVQATYETAYIQHVPMEPQAAAAEWTDGALTVWAGSQVPVHVHARLAEVFELPADSARVIVPDTGGGFGGKHWPEAAIHAARLARAAGAPVSLRWTREEEFTWAYYRPAAVIEARGGLDADGDLTAWDFATINAGRSALDTPYDVPNVVVAALDADAPLPQGAYRALGSTANVFARESLMDELAHAAEIDPLAFRLARLSDARMRAVLEDAAERSAYTSRERTPGVGMGIACGTEKGSCVAACVEVAVDEERGAIDVRHIWQTFECGAIQDPANLDAQVRGCIIMGLGGALTEAIAFEDGRVLNASLHQYRVPRFADVPPMSVRLLDRPDLPSAGAGEAPIVAVAPAIANAVFDAVGVRLRSMPLTLT